MADLSLVKFTADIAAFQKIVRLAPALLMRRLILDAFRKVTLKTPVDTGRARAGWAVSIGTPVIQAPPPGNYGAPALPDVAGIDATQVVYLLNSVEYIEPLEDGHSKQAPNGMVALTVMEIEAEIESVILANP